jgi:hypothetical protein
MKTWVEIDAAALRHNFRSLSRLAKPAKTMAVIKADAYGHGLLACANILKREAAWFGVDNIDEGLALREQGIKQPILLIGYTPEDRLAEAVKHELSITVFHLKTLRALLALKGKKPRGEVTSTSNCTDYQARRLNVRIKRKDGTVEYAHTLNGTAAAMSRALIAIMENYQQADGTIKVPDVLVPFTGFDTIG